MADGSEDAVDSSLGARLDAVQGSLDTLEREITKENKLRAERTLADDKRRRWLTRAVVVGLIVAIGGVIVGAKAFSAANEAHDAQKASAASTADARRGACIQYNRQQHAQIEFQKALSRSNADILSPPPRSAKDQAAVDAALKIDDNLTDRHFPFRDCTPSGLAAYYSVPQG